MEYKEAKAKWNGNTSNSSYYMIERKQGASHETAVIMAVMAGETK